jgi:hypothetical protein
LQDQIARLSGEQSLAATVEPDQVRWASFAAVATGARGLLFRSRNRLDGQDPKDRLRSAMLRQINRELEFVAPWAAAGTALGEQQTNNPRVRVFALRTDRARLLIVLRRVSDQQFTTASVDQQPVAFTLHNIPPTDQTYSVSPAGVDLVPSQRGGGIRLTLDSPDIVSFVLLTSDPLAVNYMGRTAAAIRSETAVARREAVSLLLDETEAVEQIFQNRGTTSTRHQQSLVQARGQLRRAYQLQESGDLAGLLSVCDLAANAVRRVRRDRWEQTVLGFNSPAASPLCASYSTLPAHAKLGEHLSTAAWGIDLLAGGEMENLEHLLSSGWKQERAELPGVSMDVQISLEAPRVGRSALHLRSWSTDSRSPALDGESPVTITSAPIPVQAGQLLRIRGWAKVPRRLDGSWDGLMIYDSHTGRAIAERIAETQGWREFTLYRVATSTGDWHVVFDLSGLGEAWVDGVSVSAMANNPIPTMPQPKIPQPGVAPLSNAPFNKTNAVYPRTDLTPP